MKVSHYYVDKAFRKEFGNQKLKTMSNIVHKVSTGNQKGDALCSKVYITVSLIIDYWEAYHGIKGKKHLQCLPRCSTLLTHIDILFYNLFTFLSEKK